MFRHTSGHAGLWSYAPAAPGSHRFDNFSVTLLGGGVHPKARGLARPVAQTGPTPAPNQVFRLYYHANGRPIAMRVLTPGNNTGTLYYLLSDHLGSISAVTDLSGSAIARQWYHPYGGVRASTGTLPTRRGYTGQLADETGLYFYNARYYSPLLGRFISADSIVPELGNPQSLNRFSYVRNNPLRYTDPSGHCEFDASGNITRFDCYAYEFEKLSAADRIKWVEAMMRLSGASGWFNNIIDIIKYFEGSPILHHMAPGSWASWADAGVLQAIQNGWVLRSGGTPVSTSGGAAQLWADFFVQGALSGFSDEATLKPYWGKAEQAGVDYG
ncbi:MAG: RHS repeat-associated core domain-containing protein, partial [Anaerolineales bacterium]|nr:RHS repeat-associated core domain-containing protein [Anaerolineales bacterium]